MSDFDLEKFKQDLDKIADGQGLEEATQKFLTEGFTEDEKLRLETSRVALEALYQEDPTRYKVELVKRAFQSLESKETPEERERGLTHFFRVMEAYKKSFGLE